MRIVVIDTYEGPRLVARGRCGCCGFDGWDQFDVGLTPKPGGEPGEFDFDPESAACPKCGVHEVTFPDGFGPTDEDIRKAGGPWPKAT